MKVTTQFGISGLHGNKDGLIYYMLPNCTTLLARSMPTRFAEAQQHDDYRKIAGNVSRLNPSVAYKNDFKVYTALYKELPNINKGVSGWYNLYIKMLWAMQKDGLADLKVLTKDEIYQNNLPCKSVRNAVEAGYLPVVTNFENLDNGI
jgi:hypothetical protein